MRLGVVGLALLSGMPAAPLQHEGDHQGTFEEALAHRSGTDLYAWKEKHPWSLGDRIAGFLGELLAVRRAADRNGVERHQLDAAYLVESIAQDPFSGWIVDVLAWDTEAGARQETAAEAMRALPSMIATGEGAAAWAQIEEVRETLAPPGGVLLLAPDLARCAAGYLHAGDRDRAKKLAAELAGSAEDLRQGAVLCACERVLGELARLEGDVAGMREHTERAFGIAASLDSGGVTLLLDAIEALDACDVDAVVEILPEGSGSTLVVVGRKERAVRRIPIDARALRERLGPAKAGSADAASLPALRESLLGPSAALFGKTIGFVADGALAELPLETLASEDGAIVRLARPPLGAVAEARAPATAKRTWLAILDEGAASPTLGSDEVRTFRGSSVDEIRKAAKGCTHLYVDAELPEGLLRGGKLDAVLAVLVRPSSASVAEALHASGVRDVLACARTPGDEERRALAEVCKRVSSGTPLLESLRAARASSSWIVRRRA